MAQQSDSLITTSTLMPINILFLSIDGWDVFIYVRIYDNKGREEYCGCRELCKSC